MPGLGFPEMLFIFVAALLLFGPRRLPELGRTLGKGLAEFRRASNELKRSLDAEGLEEDLRTTRETIRSVDPRRYIKEAMEADEEAGRVARGRVDPPDGEPASPAAGRSDDAPDDGRRDSPRSDDASDDGRRGGRSDDASDDGRRGSPRPRPIAGTSDPRP